MSAERREIWASEDGGSLRWVKVFSTDQRLEVVPASERDRLEAENVILRRAEKQQCNRADDEGDRADRLCDITEYEIKRRFEAVLSDDEAMRRARAAFLAGPPHGIKHSDADRLEHMRNAIRAAFESSPVFRDSRVPTPEQVERVREIHQAKRAVRGPEPSHMPEEGDHA